MYYCIMGVLVILGIYLEQCNRSDLELECFLLFLALLNLPFVHFMLRLDSRTFAGLSFLNILGRVDCYIGSDRDERTDL